jgi:hypothetical protein
MDRGRWINVGVFALYWGIGVATVVIADKAGMVHQSSRVAYWLGAALRAWFWPAFWLWKIRAAVLGF